MNHIFYACLALAPVLYVLGFGWLAFQAPVIFLLTAGMCNGLAAGVDGWTPLAPIAAIAIVVCLPRIVAKVREDMPDA